MEPNNRSGPGAATLRRKAGAARLSSLCALSATAASVASAAASGTAKRVNVAPNGMQGSNISRRRPSPRAGHKEIS